MSTFVQSVNKEHLHLMSLFMYYFPGLRVVAVTVLTPNLCGRRFSSCGKVSSYLLMPGGLQCSMQWFPPPVN